MRLVHQGPDLNVNQVLACLHNAKASKLALLLHKFGLCIGVRSHRTFWRPPARRSASAQHLLACAG